MTLIDNRKVVQSNDLIKGVARMDAVPLKIFELAVSLIDPINPPKNNIVTLSKAELFDFFDVSSDSKYTRFRESIKKLQENSVFQVSYEEDKKGYKYKSIVPIPYVEWTDFDDEVQIRFDEAIIPYLINLKENFTQYLISDIGSLNSKHSIVLYKWLTMNFNLFKKYGNITSKNPIISVKELRILTDTEQEYKRFFDFEKRVLAEPIEEINKNTHYHVEYEKIKKGRSVKEIQFFIQENKKNQEEYINQKYEQYEERELDHTQSLNNTLSDALQSEYVAYLIEKGIIKFNDVESLVRAYNELIPYYRDICRLKPNAKDTLEPFRKHINYVAEHMVEIDKKFTNIINYLKECADRYLDKLETQEGQESLF